MDSVYWVVLKRKFLTLHAEALFETQDEAYRYADLLEEQGHGIYVVQRVPLVEVEID